MSHEVSVTFPIDTARGEKWFNAPSSPKGGGPAMSEDYVREDFMHHMELGRTLEPWQGPFASREDAEKVAKKRSDEYSPAPRANYPTLGGVMGEPTETAGEPLPTISAEQYNQIFSPQPDYHKQFGTDPEVPVSRDKQPLTVRSEEDKNIALGQVQEAMDGGREYPIDPWTNTPYTADDYLDAVSKYDDGMAIQFIAERMATDVFGEPLPPAYKRPDDVSWLPPSRGLPGYGSVLQPPPPAPTQRSPDRVLKHNNAREHGIDIHTGLPFETNLKAELLSASPVARLGVIEYEVGRRLREQGIYLPEAIPRTFTEPFTGEMAYIRWDAEKQEFRDTLVDPKGWGPAQDAMLAVQGTQAAGEIGASLASYSVAGRVLKGAETMGWLAKLGYKVTPTSQGVTVTAPAVGVTTGVTSYGLLKTRKAIARAMDVPEDIIDTITKDEELYHAKVVGGLEGAGALGIGLHRMYQNSRWGTRALDYSPEELARLEAEIQLATAKIKELERTTGIKFKFSAGALTDNPQLLQLDGQVQKYAKNLQAEEIKIAQLSNFLFMKEAMEIVANKVVPHTAMRNVQQVAKQAQEVVTGPRTIARQKAAQAERALNTPEGQFYHYDTAALDNIQLPLYQRAEAAAQKEVDEWLGLYKEIGYNARTGKPEIWLDNGRMAMQARDAGRPYISLKRSSFDGNYTTRLDNIDPNFEYLVSKSGKGKDTVWTVNGPKGKKDRFASLEEARAHLQELSSRAFTPTESTVTPLVRTAKRIMDEANVSYSTIARDSRIKFLESMGFTKEATAARARGVTQGDMLEMLSQDTLDLRQVNILLSELRTHAAAAGRHGGINPDNGFSQRTLKDYIEAIEEQILNGEYIRSGVSTVKGAPPLSVTVEAGKGFTIAGRVAQANNATIRRHNLFDDQAIRDMIETRAATPDDIERGLRVVKTRKGDERVFTNPYPASLNQILFQKGGSTFNKVMEIAGENPAVKAAMSKVFLNEAQRRAFVGVPGQEVFQQGPYNAFRREFSNAEKSIFGEEGSKRLNNIDAMSREADRLQREAKRTEKVLNDYFGTRMNPDVWYADNIADEILFNKAAGPGAARYFRQHLSRANPKLWEEVQRKGLDQLNDRMIAQNGVFISPRSLNKLVTERPESIIQLYGKEYFDNLSLVNDVAKLLDLTTIGRPFAGQRTAQPAIVQVFRAMLGPLTKKQRFISAWNRLMGHRATKHMANILTDPTAIRQFVKLRRLPPSSFGALATVINLGLDGLIEDRFGFSRDADAYNTTTDSLVEAGWSTDEIQDGRRLALSLARFKSDPRFEEGGTLARAAESGRMYRPNQYLTYSRKDLFGFMAGMKFIPEQHRQAEAEKAMGDKLTAYQRELEDRQGGRQ